MTWNIEGFSRNCWNLLKILQDEDPSLIFITEPWLHLSDAPLVLKEYLHQYNYFLNSEDRHDSLLSLGKSRAHGGTLALWKKELDPYITVHEPSSSHVLAIILEKPGYQTSIHITVYLSTAGKDGEFMKDLVLLQNTIDHLGDKYPDSLIFVRGDANASFIQRNKNKRDDLFRYFVEENKFSPLLLNHKTYHHFLNNGLSDSNIDVIMYPKVTSDGLLSSTTESLIKILCGKTNALVDSSHDVLITSLLLPPQPQPDVSPDNILAPKVKHSKYKVLWSEEGILEYQNLLSQTLPSLQSDYCDVSEPEVASVLFQVTNHILNEAAKRTNKCIELGKAPKAKKPFIPSEIKQALKSKEDALKKLNNIDARTATEKQSATDEYKSAKSVHQKLVRKHNISQEVDRDNDLLALLS